MKRIFAMTLLLAAALTLSGCLIPGPTFMSAGLGGRILDARTEQPIAGATVTVTYTSYPFTEESISKRVVTGTNGDFNFPVESVRRWGSHKDNADPRIKVPGAVTVQCPGYESFAYFFRRARQETGKPGQLVLVPVVENSRSYGLIPLDVQQVRQ